MTQAQLPRIPELPETGALWRTEQLHASGLNSGAIKLLLRHGQLVRLRYGCYIRASAWKEQSSTIRSRQLIHAHAHGTLTTSAGGYVYSHTSAARLHRLFLWNVDDLIHVLLGVRPSSERLGRDVRGHTRAYAESDVVSKEKLRVTSLERTVVDCAMMLSYQQGLVLMDQGLRLGADRELMQAMADPLVGRRGIRNLRKALVSADPRSESAGETLCRELISRLKLPVPEAQVEVQSRAGRHRLDFAWKEKRVALEFDGKVKYFDYTPTADVIFEERRREKALSEDGWRFVRVEWKDLFREQEFKARILTALRR